MCRNVERYLPATLLAGLGLLTEPPHCQISVPAAEPGLLQVTWNELKLLPIPLSAEAQVLPHRLVCLKHLSMLDNLRLCLLLFS